MGKSDLAHRHALQAACGKWGSVGPEQSPREWGGGGPQCALDTSLDLSSSIWSKKGLESTISAASQFRQSGLHPRVPCRGWEVGLGQASGRLTRERQRKWLELLEPPTPGCPRRG